MIRNLECNRRPSYGFGGYDLRLADMKTIWTVWADYGGTGEGQTWLVWIGYALDAAEAQESFTDRFGEFFAKFCDIAAGVILNESTERLIPPGTAQRLEGANGKAQVEFYAQMHLNYS